MKCPRCEASSLTELDRDGVTIDRCERCRGIWLDRGELEKLLAFSRDEEGSGRRAGGDDDDDDSDDGDRRRDRDRGGGGGGGRRRSWWEIFD